MTTVPRALTAVGRAPRRAAVPGKTVVVATGPAGRAAGETATTAHATAGPVPGATAVDPASAKGQAAKGQAAAVTGSLMGRVRTAEAVVPKPAEAPGMEALAAEVARRAVEMPDEGVPTVEMPAEVARRAEEMSDEGVPTVEMPDGASPEGLSSAEVRPVVDRLHRARRTKHRGHGATWPGRASVASARTSCPARPSGPGETR
ncbi:MAG: hypothetical protein ACR2H3_17215 [Acidimicrobiales bacterium]